ncbi:MAG: FecR domain-containing protein [Thermoflexales bacterium]|nr:FecR domain-containing protein [Thermoflexales bacterium]
MRTSKPDTRWEAPDYLEQTLAESGRRVRGLSPQQHARLLRALRAESAELQRRGRRAPLVPLLRLGFALAAAVLIASAYLLFGGVRVLSDARVEGFAVVRERRQGIFNLQWWIEQPPRQLVAAPLGIGDEVIALEPVTITLADGSALFAQPNARLQFVEDNVLFLAEGELTSVIAPQAQAAGFRVETRAGTMQVRGTVFRARVLDEQTAREYTDEGIVTVSTPLGSADVVTGEQALLSRVMPLTVELQAPRVRIASAAPDRVLVNTRTLRLQAFIYPNARLLAYDADRNTLIGILTASAGGVVSGTLTLPAEAEKLSFEQASPDGRRSARSAPVTVTVDIVGPTLRLERVEPIGARVRVAGQTEAGAVVRVNGRVVSTDPSGAFEAVVELLNGTVTVIATDAAGNSAFVVQRLR